MIDSERLGFWAGSPRGITPPRSLSEYCLSKARFE